jgi:hypothetical protein
MKNAVVRFTIPAAVVASVAFSPVGSTGASAATLNLAAGQPAQWTAAAYVAPATAPDSGGSGGLLSWGMPRPFCGDGTGGTAPPNPNFTACISNQNGIIHGTGNTKRPNPKSMHIDICPDGPNYGKCYGPQGVFPGAASGSSINVPANRLPPGNYNAQFFNNNFVVYSPPIRVP